MAATHVTVADAVRDFGKEGPWWLACEHPERPPDQWVLWSWDCDACLLHMRAAVAHDPGHMPYYVADDGSIQITPLAEAYDRAVTWRDNQL